jgi:hypothetical protein
MFSVSAVYLFINVAYFAAVSKTDILESRRIVALVIYMYHSLQSFMFSSSVSEQGVVFQEPFWPCYGKSAYFCPWILCSSAQIAVYLQALSAFIALSTLGNLLAGQFSQGRGMSFILAIG